MSAPAKKPVAKPKASLIAAASKPKAPTAAPSAAAEPAPAPAPTAGPSTGMQRTATAISSGSGSNSARSTPTVQDGPVVPVARMKFKPKVPVKKARAVPDVKPEIVEPAAFSRGGMRGGRGARGGPGGRGGRGGRGGAAQPSVSIAAGIFGGPRNLPSTRGGGSFAPRAAYDDVADVYSDDEETGTSAANIVDISAVSGLGESAPTSLIRAGRETGKTKEEEDEKKRRKDERIAKRDRSKRKGKERAYGNVKGEEDVKPDLPPSPVKRDMDMDMDDMEEMMNAGVRPPVGLREDDHLMEGDLNLDTDEQGRRLGEEDEVNEAQMMDLSESEEEEEEESMEGDFVPTPGYDNPSSKLYIFQFPHLFPNFVPRGPVDLTGEGDVKPDVKPDLKPSDAELRAEGRKKKAKPQPEGRVGSLVVMRSGKVKVVMGNDIVMNITPGVPCTFLQHLVHLDTPKKSVNVLGEVNKHYVITPDIDRLLKELWLNDGETPGEKAEKARAQVKLEEERNMGGLQRIDDD